MLSLFELKYAVRTVRVKRKNCSFLVSIFSMFLCLDICLGLLFGLRLLCLPVLRFQCASFRFCLGFASFLFASLLFLVGLI